MNLCFGQGEIHKLNNVIDHKISQNTAVFPIFHRHYGDIVVGQSSKNLKVLLGFFLTLVIGHILCFDFTFSLVTRILQSFTSLSHMYYGHNIMHLAF